MFLIFDTETTGLPLDYNAPYSNSENWPRMVQLAWQVHDKTGKFIYAKSIIIQPDGYTIPYSAEKVHGISTQKALAEGIALVEALQEFNQHLSESTILIGHNVEFDINIVAAELFRTKFESSFINLSKLCTKVESTDFCALPGGKGGKYKWPNLAELHIKLFNKSFSEAHNAAADVAATARCFLELVRKGIIAPSKLKMNQDELTAFRVNYPSIVPYLDLNIISNKSTNSDNQPITISPAADDFGYGKVKITNDYSFSHLHVHTQYSILDGAADILGLISKAKADGMLAVAITDHGNMFGAKEFHNTAKKQGIKPILGCEVYMARRTRFDQDQKIDGGGHHLILLAKNKVGYQNLTRLVSLGYTEGYYYKPRIDKELLHKYSEGLIALTACINGEIPNAIRNKGIEEVKVLIKEYQSIFGEDFYFEIQRHKSGNPIIDKEVFEDQNFINAKLLELSAEFGIKVVASNDVHFINKEDAQAHDRLLCLSTGKDLDDPNRMRYTQQEWFKTRQEMAYLFADVPEALLNTQEVVDKIEVFELNSPPIMPDFPLPEGFTNEDVYLKHITYDGAKIRYGEIIPESIVERIDFELETIQKMGFPGYFLIVWDFIKAAREMGVSVGPGRGSAAGSVVAYSLRITDIDPVKYDLLFERFLNPDRVSMPDIDIDFDEDGREKVLEWVVNKYGVDKVAHIITFGTMAPKMAIRDVARVQKLPLSEADRLAKLVPERPGTSFKSAYKEVSELVDARNSPDEEISSVLKYAEVLEGSVRQVGIHACGIIISRNNLMEHLPVCKHKEAKLLVTQYDGKHVESVGMLKMDFLGLKTLSIIKDALDNIKISKGIDVDIDKIPLDDQKTYELYSRGDTTGLFQFESPGMKKHLRALKPNRFEDLIAMNALYRPGPMEYIPSFIARKHGQEKIEYDLPEMNEYLEDTYGITVYQEQVMLLSQKLAGFTKGMADSLRKAMGKKIKAMMDDLKQKFIDGCLKNNHPENKVLKIWSDWEAFAQYAFNKSHSTCYAYISYQTAYLKANYPAEFMAAVLSRNLNDIKKITFFMSECRRMGSNVKGPDVNESFLRFTVNKKGDIRFGMAAIKNVGEAAVENIIQEREKNGAYTDVYDFIQRVNLNVVNKRNIEALVLAGGFDSFGFQRHQYFSGNDRDGIFLDNLVKFGNRMQNDNNSMPSLFGGSEAVEIARPTPFPSDEWSSMYTLNKEKEMVGIYLSAHPLDDFRFEMDHLNVTPLSELHDLKKWNGREITIAGLVTEANERITKTGNPFGNFTLEDYVDSYSITLFSKDYLLYKSYFTRGYSIIVKGKVQENPWRKDSGELEFKVTSMGMLAQVRDEMVKNIQLKIPLSKLSDELIENIGQFATGGKDGGKVLLKFLIIDPVDNIGLEMFSRSQKVNITTEFIDYLTNDAEIEYKVNA